MVTGAGGRDNETDAGDHRSGGTSDHARDRALPIMGPAAMHGDAAAGVRTTSALHLAITDTDAGFDSLEPEWRTLLTRAERPSVFLDWDWHRLWWQVYARRRDRLHIVTLREHGRLVGLLPLYCRGGPGWRSASLRFIGTGEARHEEVGTEYADLLLCADAHEDRQRERAAAVVAHLASFASWRSVELRCLLDDARILRGVHASGVSSVDASAGLRYRVRLADGDEGHRRRLGTQRVRRIARARRAVERDGGLHGVSAGIDTLERALSQLHRLARVRRIGRGQRSTSHSARFRRFHRLLCERWVASGQARLVGYRIGDVDVASVYAFRCRDTLHYYQSGFTDQGANRWMPLTLAHLAEMQIAREQGLSFYDLMRGEPPCYKDDFGCETQPMRTLHVFSSPARCDRFLRARALRRRLVAGLAALNIRRN